MATNLSEHPEFETQHESTSTTRCQATFDEYVLAFFRKYPHKRLNLVNNCFPFDFRREGEHRLVYYRVKYAKKGLSWFNKNVVEKVVIDLKHRVMETVELCVRKDFTFCKQFLCDRVVCTGVPGADLEISKHYFSPKELNYFQNKIKNFGRKVGDAVMEELIANMRLEFEFA